MKQLLCVGVGGCIGSVLRYTVGGWVLHHALDWRFPLGTFIVNVLGCLLAGLIAGIAEKHNVLSEDIRLFLFTGFLGGFTTFSAFGLETVVLLRRGETWVAFGYVLASVVVGLSVLWFGMSVARAT